MPTKLALGDWLRAVASPYGVEVTPRMVQDYFVAFKNESIAQLEDAVVAHIEATRGKPRFPTRDDFKNALRTLASQHVDSDWKKAMRGKRLDVKLPKGYLVDLSAEFGRRYGQLLHDSGKKIADQYYREEDERADRGELTEAAAVLVERYRKAGDEAAAAAIIEHHKRQAQA